MFIISKFIAATLWQLVLRSERCWWWWWCWLSERCLTLKCVKMLSLWRCCHTHTHTNCCGMQAAALLLPAPVRVSYRATHFEICVLFIFMMPSHSSSNYSSSAAHPISASIINLARLSVFGSQFKKSFQVSCFNKFQVKVLRIHTTSSSCSSSSSSTSLAECVCY